MRNNPRNQGVLLSLAPSQARTLLHRAWRANVPVSRRYLRAVKEQTLKALWQACGHLAKRVHGIKPFVQPGNEMGQRRFSRVGGASEDGKERSSPDVQLSTLKWKYWGETPNAESNA